MRGQYNNSMGDMMTGFTLGTAAGASHGTSVVINTDPEVFLNVVERNKDGLVVMSESGLLRTKHPLPDQLQGFNLLL